MPCVKINPQFFEDHGILLFSTPPESLDCKPIENMWYELKHYIRTAV